MSIPAYVLTRNMTTPNLMATALQPSPLYPILQSVCSKIHIIVNLLLLKSSKTLMDLYMVVIFIFFPLICGCENRLSYQLHPSVVCPVKTFETSTLTALNSCCIAINVCVPDREHCSSTLHIFNTFYVFISMVPPF